MQSHKAFGCAHAKIIEDNLEISLGSHTVELLEGLAHSDKNRLCYCVFYLASSDLISMFNLGALHLQLQLYLLYPYVSYIEIVC
jgi:hypothetical protein